MDSNYSCKGSVPGKMAQSVIRYDNDQFTEGHYIYGRLHR
jgi:hypothetical protein